MTTIPVPVLGAAAAVATAVLLVAYALLASPSAATEAPRTGRGKVVIRT